MEHHPAGETRRNVSAFVWKGTSPRGADRPRSGYRRIDDFVDISANRQIYGASMVAMARHAGVTTWARRRDGCSADCHTTFHPLSHQEAKDAFVDNGDFSTGWTPEDWAEWCLSEERTTDSLGARRAPTYNADLLSDLRSGVDAAIGGHGQLMLIRCDDEPGRTALDALEDHAHARSVRTLRVTCEAGEDGTPLQPWLKVLPEPGQDPHAAEACRVPRFARFAMLLRTLHDSTLTTPHLVILENIDRADRASLLLLEALASQLPSWSLAAVATYREPYSRTHPLRETLVELRRDPQSRWLSIDPDEPQEAERAVFRRDGDYWTIAFEEKVVRLRDTKGLRIIAILLGRPGDLVHVSTLPIGGAYGRTGGTGVHQRADERTRVAATKNIKNALERIAAAHPSLGRYLSATVRRGYHCGYVPDARRPIAWEL